MIYIASGEYLIVSSTAVLTIPALVSNKSSLLIPGLRGSPAVTTIILDPAVAS